MRRTYLLMWGCVLVFMIGWAGAFAGGILPDRVNKVTIIGRFNEQAPAFLLVFSAQPLSDGQGNLLTSITEAELAKVRENKEHVCLEVLGKQPSRTGQLDYSFGTGEDADRLWNDGKGFQWKDWEKSSPDVWDNLCILSPSKAGSRNRCVITDVVIVKSGKTLFDSKARASYPNKKPMDASMQPLDLTPQQARLPVLNLAERMAKFRRDHYELGNSRILELAYADLGQTEKRKYANRGTNWCSEFSSYLYRANGIMAPDPNRGDVHWKNMREFFEKNGQVYPLREVAGWSNDKKLTTIKPGSFVSIVLGESTHSIIFTTWVVEPGKPITRWVGVSGNNKGMVWPHSPMTLPTAEDLKGRSVEALEDYDQKAYIAVPSHLK